MAHNPSSGKMKHEDHKIKISLNYIIKIKAHAWRKRRKEEEKEGRKVRRKDGRKENKKKEGKKRKFNLHASLDGQIELNG